MSGFLTRLAKGMGAGMESYGTSKLEQQRLDRIERVKKEDRKSQQAFNKSEREEKETFTNEQREAKVGTDKAAAEALATSTYAKQELVVEGQNARQAAIAETAEDRNAATIKAAEIRSGGNNSKRTNVKPIVDNESLDPNPPELGTSYTDSKGRRVEEVWATDAKKATKKVNGKMVEPTIDYDNFPEGINDKKSFNTFKTEFMNSFQDEEKKKKFKAAYETRGAGLIVDAYMIYNQQQN